MFRTIKDYNFSGKRVLVRCDFNLPSENGKITDDFRVKNAAQTILFLKEQGARVLLISHFGKPKKKNKEESLEKILPVLRETLKTKIDFFNNCVGEEALKLTNKMKSGEILLLENLRFEQGEEENDDNFAKKLAELGDVFVNEAFSVCHRHNASVAKLPAHLLSFAGFNLEKEVENLSRILESPENPLVVIIGGVKVSSKIKVIENFLELADHVLLGGKIPLEILTVKGILLGKPWPEEEVVEKIRKINLTNRKLHLPLDVLVSPDESGEVYVRETGPAGVRSDEDIFDIGKETISSFSEIISAGKTIFWAGPMGLYENEKFQNGTLKIAQAIARNSSTFKVAGGGDTVAALKKFNLLEKFSYVSSGGGAMLEFLAGEKLPGLEALK